MPLAIVLDFHTADLRTRERFYPGGERVAAILGGPRTAAVHEVVLVATCNRLELYGAPSPGDAPDPRVRAAEMATRWMGSERAGRELLEAATVHTGADAARHLLRVSAGLESQVLGDAQVLGQIRRAFRDAVDAGAAGPVLHRLFETALRAGKRVAAETALTASRSTVGAEAAAVAARRAGPLAERRCVVVGCGKTGEQAARRLAKLGAGELVLVNRSPARAAALAIELRARAAPWETLHQEVARADVAVVVTGAELPPVRAGSLAFCRAGAGTEGRPLLVLDLSVPRNVEPETAGLAGITVLDMDSLRPPLAAAEEARRVATPAAERIVHDEVGRFVTWRRESAARAAVEPLRAVLEEVCRRELSFAAGPDAAAVAAERIVARVLARPMSALRAAGHDRDVLREAAALLESLFTAGAARGGEVPAAELLREAS